jgi:hypothetical protein
MQRGPSEVRASAPGGLDSSWTWTEDGVGLNESKENEGSEEQPPRLAPAAAIAMARRMINPSLTAANCHNLGPLGCQPQATGRGRIVN